MTGHILLDTNSCNQKLLLIEQEITCIRDQLSILQTEEERLVTIWQGEAKTVWCSEFQRKLTEVSVAVKEIGNLISDIKQTAKGLLEKERSVYEIIEML